MLDVLFVRPNSKKVNYQALDDFKMTATEPPFWALLLASYLDNNNVNCRILDEEVATLQEINETIYSETDPLLTVITVCGQNPSASTMSMAGIDRTISFIKSCYPYTKIMLHGLHPSALPIETLESNPDIDFVCEGEGFLTILQVINVLKHEDLHYKLYDSSVCGLWSKNTKVRVPHIIKDLGILPPIMWGFVRSKRYRAHNWHCFEDIKNRSPYGLLYTSLGCPFKCDFCCIHSMFAKNSGIRYRSMENVKRDLWNLHNWRIKNVKIMDELFTLNKERVLQICNEIIVRPYNFNFWAYARAENIDGAIAKTMKKAGINWLGFGFESGSQEILDKSNKKQKVSSIMEAVNICKGEGINIGANFIFGLPDDHEGTMNETLNLALEINAEWANFYSCIAYPGSKLYEDAQNFPWYNKPESWSAYSQYSYDCQPLGTKYLTPAEVLKFRDTAFNVYFTNSNYLSMIENKFGTETKNHIVGMTEVNLKRKLLGD